MPARLRATGSGRFLRIPLQFQNRQRRVPEILVEDGCQVHSRFLVEVPHHVLGHDVLILEVLVEPCSNAHQRGSSSTTLRRVFRKSAPLKYWSSGGVLLTPRAEIIGCRFFTFDFNPLRYFKASARPQRDST